MVIVRVIVRVIKSDTGAVEVHPYACFALEIENVMAVSG